jgi:hypothetical protein
MSRRVMCGDVMVMMGVDDRAHARVRSKAGVGGEVSGNPHRAINPSGRELRRQFSKPSTGSTCGKAVCVDHFPGSQPRSAA